MKNYRAGERFVKSCVPVFVPQNNGPLFTHYQKLRVLILYVLNKKGELWINKVQQCACMLCIFVHFKIS